MNRRTHLYAVCASLLVMLLASSMMSKALAQGRANAASQLPPGKWTLTTGFCWRPECESAPLLLYTITTDATKGAGVTTVGFQNRSQMPVAAVRLNWYLTTQEDQNTLLLQGQTPLLYFPNALASNSKWSLEYNVVSFGQIHKPLLKNGVLNGNFHIMLAVSEVLYEDGSNWSRADSKETAVKSAGHAKARPQGCPRQTCAIDSSGAFYTCQSSSNNEACTNNSDGTRCTRTICGTTGDGGQAPGTPPRPN
jgi:hypothetical protein